MTGFPHLRVAVTAALASLALAHSPVADATPDPAAGTVVHVAYLGQRLTHPLPHSFLEVPPTDEGVAGARVGIADDNTTGGFTGQNFVMDEAIVAQDGDVVPAFRSLRQSGQRLFIVDLPGTTLLTIADLPEGKSAMLFNISATDDVLRGASCRANILHLAPSRAMLADALVQYLVLKRWRDILLVPGPTDADQAYAVAVARSIKKFGAKLVEQRPWTFKPGARRTDTGQFAISAEVGRFTQGVSYDVLVVADEEGEFGNEIPFRTTDPRPVAGTQGMVPTAWARPFEGWGATQLQNRFRHQAGRWMGNRDYAGWLAARAIAEAATRAQSTDIDAILRYMRSEKFDLAGFKGVKLTFRDWDGQLRQPVLLADFDAVVSVSPQQGFLHQFSELDTLGIDRPETQCKMTR